MSNFIGRPPFSNSLWVGIETMQFHIAQTKIFLRTPSFPIQGVPMNNLAPMKNCPGGVQGNLNWMPGYYKFTTRSDAYLFSSDHHKRHSFYCKVTLIDLTPPFTTRLLNTIRCISASASNLVHVIIKYILASLKRS